MAAGIACKQSGKVNRIFNKQFRVGAGTIIPEKTRGSLCPSRFVTNTFQVGGGKILESVAIIKFIPPGVPSANSFLFSIEGKRKGKKKRKKYALPRSRTRADASIAPLCIDIKYTLSILAKFSRGEQPAG